MPILRKIKSLLGRDDRSESGQDVTVTVEHEPEAEPETEAAVKGVDVEESEDELEAATESEEAPEPEPETEPSGAGESVDLLNGIGPAYADRLANAGVETVADLADADAADLAEATDIAEGRLQGWIGQAQDY